MPASPSCTLSATDLAVRVGARTLVSGLDLTIADGDVVALVGPNGAGKSTLMRTLAGGLPPESGVVRLSPPGASVAWLPQVPPDPRQTLLDYVRVRTGVHAADQALEAASSLLAATAEDVEGSAAADDYALALDRWLSLGAADLEERLAAVSARVGLDVDPTRPLGSLSGGQAARACLIAILLSRHEVLMLDEPTNNLDLRGVEAVTDFVQAHRGPVLVASHDRRFLDTVATHVVELDLHQRTVSHHTGGWSDYVASRELARRHAHEAWADYVSSRDHLVAQASQRQEWGARGHRAASRGDEPDKHQREKSRARADRQQARAARLRRAADRLQVVEQPRKEWQLRYRLEAGPAPAGVVATLDQVVVQRDGFVLGPVTRTLSRGDRVAVLGDNGSGKSTLLSVLTGQLAPDGGRWSLGSRVEMGVLDQERAALDDDRTVVALVRHWLGDPDEAEVRTLLAKFGLGADHVQRPARTLSMGERTRALMATFQAREVNLLVLDEPTNHLDVPAIEQLEAAVSGFDGTVVVVSHDRTFLEAVGTTCTWQVTDGQLTDASPG